MSTQESTAVSYFSPRARAAAELSDSDVVKRVLSGDEAAFEVIMRRYNRLLFRLARGIMKTDGEAADALQDSYVRAYYRLSQFKGPAGFPSWLSRIVINECLSRSRGKRIAIDGDADVDMQPVTSAARPEELAMTDEVRRVLEAAISTLPTDFRIVFMMRGVEELSIAETAELLGIKEATVKTRFHRARRLLQDTLEKKAETAALSTFSFDGRRCDSIVSGVFSRLSLNSKART